tara:strand:+ start:3473 stop:4054 length:582 start_codon:yes stop_codon:yes gene_type:complete
MASVYSTQNDLLLNKLLQYYSDKDKITQMLSIINGESSISLRIVDWFVTNYAKKNFTQYEIKNAETNDITRFKVYNDYKLKLKSYSKKRFDPFCRWERINIPYINEQHIQTTIGQLNFFKWALENKIIDYIRENYNTIEHDMNDRNSTSKSKKEIKETINGSNNKTRKKREELSVFASRSIKKEHVEIVVSFN